MPDVPDEAWRRLREIDAWWRALPSPDGADAAQTEWIDSIPANTWQEMQDGQATAISEIRANAELMTALRAVAREADDPVELALLYTVLRDAVIDYQTDPAAIAGDPRVDWDARTMETCLSVYLPEGTLLGDSGDSGDSELPALDAADESARELTLIGGTPTRFPGLADPPGSEFLLQFDCAVLRRAAGHEGVARLVRENSLPRQGVLQLFYAAGRDSLTTPEVPGGGTTLRHVSEAAVRRRAPGSAAGGASGWPMVLPSFGASIEASPRAREIVGELQVESDQLARSVFPDENFDAEFARNPFTARVRPVTRLFPLPSPGFELTSAELSRLHAQLPLVEPDDAHVLFVEVAPSHALGDLLRDDERLHVWLRRSDVTNRRYVDVVTFRKSAPRASAPLTRPARSGGLSA